jgi:hypothetical protein
MENLTYNYDEQIGKWKIYTYCHLKYDERSLIVIELYQHGYDIDDELKTSIARYFNGDDLYEYEYGVVTQN